MARAVGVAYDAGMDTPPLSALALIEDDDRDAVLETVLGAYRMRVEITADVRYCGTWYDSEPATHHGQFHPVSYTHLDVYKRQGKGKAMRPDGGRADWGHGGGFPSGWGSGRLAALAPGCCITATGGAMAGSPAFDHPADARRPAAGHVMATHAGVPLALAAPRMGVPSSVSPLPPLSLIHI